MKSKTTFKCLNCNEKHACDARNRPLDEAGVGALLTENLHLTADLMTSLVRDRCEAWAAAPAAAAPGVATPHCDDRTLLIVKRTHA